MRGIFPADCLHLKDFHLDGIHPSTSGYSEFPAYSQIYSLKKIRVLPYLDKKKIFQNVSEERQQRSLF